MIYYIKFIVKYYKFSTILKILHDIFITIKYILIWNPQNLYIRIFELINI